MCSNRRSRLASLTTLLALLPFEVWGAPPASAPSSRELRARAVFQTAEHEFNLGRFHNALTRYREAYAIKPLPGLLFNIAQCYRNLDRCNEAVFHYRRFLRLQPRSPYAKDVRRIIARCERRAAAPAPASAPATQPARSPSPSTPTPKRERAGRRVLLWSGVALTSALVAAGAVTGSLALGRNDRYRDPATPAADRPALRREGERLALWTNVLWVGAAASAMATTLVYWLYRAPEPPAATPTLSAAGDRLLVGLGGRF